MSQLDLSIFFTHLFSFLLVYYIFFHFVLSFLINFWLSSKVFLADEEELTLELCYSKELSDIVLLKSVLSL